jgi:hypothetical protein
MRSTRRILSAPDPRTPCAWIAGVLLAGCQIVDRPAGISLSSDPPGARVFVDKKDSGFCTPCLLGLEDDEDLRIDFVYPGYRKATRFLTPDKQVYAILWEEMYVNPATWHFPLWLNVTDFFMPIKYDKTLAPGRVFVRMEREADTLEQPALVEPGLPPREPKPPQPRR